MAKGIMFTEAMFNEVIEWRKTQTRRIVKPKPGPELFYVKKLNKNEWVESDKYTGYYSCVEDGRFYKPRYQLGEKVYIREPYDFGKHKQGDKHLPNSRVFGDIFVDYPYSDKGYYPGIKYTMPEKYARYFIEITSLRCERLQDISDEDCLKEGIKKRIEKQLAILLAFNLIISMDMQIIQLKKKPTPPLSTKSTAKEHGKPTHTCGFMTSN